MKRKSRDAGALNGRRKGMMATQHVQEASAVVSVLGDASLLRLVTSYQRGIPVVFPALAKKHGITPENIEKARREARTHGKLLEPGQTFIFNVDPTRSQYLEQLKRMQASYMEMAIKDDDFRVLKMVYKLHKRGISNEHPRFGFRRPMRVAATYGRLEVLNWLKNLEDRVEWLEDPWLLDAAFKLCSMEVVLWVHEAYIGRRPSLVWRRALDELASQGGLHGIVLSGTRPSTRSGFLATIEPRAFTRLCLKRPSRRIQKTRVWSSDIYSRSPTIYERKRMFSVKKKKAERLMKQDASIQHSEPTRPTTTTIPEKSDFWTN